MIHWLRLHSPIQYVYSQIKVGLGRNNIQQFIPTPPKSSPKKKTPREFPSHHDSPKAAMLSPYRCPRDISLVSGLRSECLSSLIGSSRALCSWHTAAYQQHAYARRCPDDCPPSQWEGVMRAGGAWTWERCEDRVSPRLRGCLFYRVSSASCRQREVRLRANQHNDLTWKPRHVCRATLGRAKG